MEVFQDYAYYYNAFYQDKDYKSEAKQIDYLLNKYKEKDIKTIINYGCGTGKHDIELCNLGYQCSGIDMSSMMIDIAKENASMMQKQIGFEVSDIRYYEPNHKYDAVISLFHVMSYQNSNEDIMNAFQAARKALGTGGIFLFDVWYGPGVLSDKPALRVKEIEDEKYKLVRIARPIMYDKDNIVDVCYEVFVIDKNTQQVKTIHETHSMRYFFRPELQKMLQDTGFELIENIDCNTLEETSYNSWTSYFIARVL